MTPPTLQHTTTMSGSRRSSVPPPAGLPTHSVTETMTSGVPTCPKPLPPTSKLHARASWFIQYCLVRCLITFTLAIAYALGALLLSLFYTVTNLQPLDCATHLGGGEARSRPRPTPTPSPPSSISGTTSTSLLRKTSLASLGESVLSFARRRPIKFTTAAAGKGKANLRKSVATYHELDNVEEREEETDEDEMESMMPDSGEEESDGPSEVDTVEDDSLCYQSEVTASTVLPDLGGKKGFFARRKKTSRESTLSSVTSSSSNSTTSSDTPSSQAKKGSKFCPNRRRGKRERSTSPLVPLARPSLPARSTSPSLPTTLRRPSMPPSTLSAPSLALLPPPSPTASFSSFEWADPSPPSPSSLSSLATNSNATTSRPKFSLKAAFTRSRSPPPASPTSSSPSPLRTRSPLSTPPLTQSPPSSVRRLSIEVSGMDHSGGSGLSIRDF